MGQRSPAPTLPVLAGRGRSQSRTDAHSLSFYQTSKEEEFKLVLVSLTALLPPTPALQCTGVPGKCVCKGESMIPSRGGREDYYFTLQTTPGTMTTQPSLRQPRGHSKAQLFKIRSWEKQQGYACDPKGLNRKPCALLLQWQIHTGKRRHPK